LTPSVNRSSRLGFLIFDFRFLIGSKGTRQSKIKNQKSHFPLHYRPLSVYDGESLIPLSLPFEQGVWG
jgi:hypothetical protein